MFESRVKAAMAGRGLVAACLGAKWWGCIEVVTVTADSSERLKGK